MSGARTSGVVAPRIDAEAALPPAFAERLLRVAWETPLDADDEAVLVEMVGALAELLPSLSVGASASEQAHPAHGSHAPGLQLFVRQAPEAPLERVRTSSSSRVFPGAAHEAVVSVPTDRGHVALHVAAEDPALVAQGSVALVLLRRAILLLARCLEHARARAESDGQEAKRILAAQMVQTDKLASLGQIAAGMVHELNNPLTSIVAYSEYLTKRWLARGDQVDAHELERLQRISTSANRLLRFTRDLVTYARPASEEPAAVPVHLVVDQAVVFCEHLLNEHQTTIVRSYADATLTVRGSREQLTQVFVNLFTNACHAMPKGGAITVTADLEAGGEDVRIVVEDAGHGIEAANLSRVFAPFFTTKAAGSGTGLGLSIVKSIIDAHQGRIWAESEPDEGARFIIVLPKP